jgi:hypothetical protein
MPFGPGIAAAGVLDLAVSEFETRRSSRRVSP